MIKNIILCFLLIAGNSAYAELAHKAPHKISFNYKNEDLVNIINYIASQRNINVILPMRPDDKINAKLSWQIDKKVTLDEAWNLLGTILTMAGYSIVPKEDYYEIVKIDKNITREPVPLYIGTAPEDLPASDQMIRYIYYLSNIKLQANEKDSEVKRVLTTLLPENSLVQMDSDTNAIIAVAPSKDIQSVMSIIMQLDRPGFKEEVAIISLEFANARLVAELFNKQILQSAQSNKYHLDAKKSPDEGEYFSHKVRIIANERTNKLIVLGRTQAIERISEFIQQYIDVKPDSGNSILHVYQLQYLDAPAFADVLRSIIQSKKSAEGTEQSTAEKKKTAGPERFFEDVIIAVDTPKAEEFADPNAGETPKEGDIKLSESKYYGSNNLIIAARSDDWKEIKKLIEKLDKPQPQVLIEVLIADLTLTDNRALGSMFRNAAKFPMPGETGFQSAQLIPGVVPDSFDNPQTIGVIQTDNGVVQTAADIARRFSVNSSGQRTDQNPNTSVINRMAPGTTAVTLNDADGKTWSIAQILKLIDNSKVLSHPHVISTDNQEARIKRVEYRLLQDKIITGEGGALSRQNKLVPATLQVVIRPRINPASETSPSGLVNLQIIVDINEFNAGSTNSIITRNVTTNATVNSGDILAIGGLIRTGESDAAGETPILSKIPFFGWFFKNRTKQKVKTNLTVFISPTIIEPRLRAGIGDYTRDYVNISTQYARSGNLFDSLKDPITRWYFQDTQSATTQFTNDFLSKDEQYKKSDIPVPTENQLGKKRKRKSATSLQVANKKEQAHKLKGLMESIENPFENLQIPQIANAQ